MWDIEQLTKLTQYIEENLRASQTSGLNFIDPRNHKERLKNKQNHVVYGRRGAGKSTLLSSLDKKNGSILINIDLEDFKDITYPNIILQIVASLLLSIKDNIIEYNKFRLFSPKIMRLLREIKFEYRNLQERYSSPDIDEQQVKTTEKGGVDGGVKVGHKGIGARLNAKKAHKTEVSGKRLIDKTEYLKFKLTNYKEWINDASKFCENKPFFLILDDYYFIKKNIQPELIDYFHRMTKDTKLYLKIGTIKNRSFLLRRTKDSIIGIETGHDVFEIDLDYTFENYPDLKDFMERLLFSAKKESGADVEMESIFAGRGFDQLCLASGGVPRDFLSLFVNLVNKYVIPNRSKIGTIQVNEEAIANIGSKKDSLKLDSGEEGNELEEYLNEIKNKVYNEKRTNAFLISKDDLDSYPQSKQAILELVDLRLIHVVDKNTSSAPSDGKRYEAYIIDVGLYANSRPRSFQQVEPGMKDKKSRRDKIRAAPRISLGEIEQKLYSKDVQLELLPYPKNENV